ncbi:MAG: signal peptidase I [Massilibacteroides sp.]|nr:signal peptidase I [Massilibacteroides sp.]
MKHNPNIHSLLCWGIILALVMGVCLCIRLFILTPFKVKTVAMCESLQRGDGILVNRILGSPAELRGRTLVFRSPSPQKTLPQPLFISRCVAVPGDTLCITGLGYTVNGKPYPRSPQTLATYVCDTLYQRVLKACLKRTRIPFRYGHPSEENTFMFRLTDFEAFQLRETLPDTLSRMFHAIPPQTYQLIVPHKGEKLALDHQHIAAIEQLIQLETGEKVSYTGGKYKKNNSPYSVYLFKQNYYWVLSDNKDEGIDSRHLGFIPQNNIIGTAWFRWLSADWTRSFQFIY